MDLSQKLRQFRISLRQRGLRTTIFWAAFGYLRPNTFVVLGRPVADFVLPPPPPGVAFEAWDAGRLRAWRAGRQGLSPEFFQCDIDGARTCIVGRADDQVFAIVWLYQHCDTSRLFNLRPTEGELNSGSVLPPWRGKGYYTHLMAAGVDWLRQHGCEVVLGAVHSTNARPIRSLVSLGFREVGHLRHIFLFRPKYRTAAPGTPAERC